MEVERDIAGFAIPFATGAFIAAYAGSHLHTGNSSCSVLALAVTAALLIVLMHPSRRRIPVPYVWLTIAAAGISAGMFTGFNGALAALTASPWKPSAALRFGEAMQTAIDTIPFREAGTNALIKALLTGARGGLDKDIVLAFRDSGASHILALSGLHLGIIYGIVRYSLSTIGNTRKAIYARYAATILLCGFYTLATGAGPSIVRAFLFILLNETARITHRHHTTGSILFAALIIQTVISPRSVMSAGFQLSYAAMAGIAFIYPAMRRFWPSVEDSRRGIGAKADILKRIWESAAMSISCQITTGPLAYLYFRSLPLNFLLTNLIALPLTGALIPAALITLALHCTGLCPSAAIRLTEWLAQTLMYSLEIIATM